MGDLDLWKRADRIAYVDAHAFATLLAPLVCEGGLGRQRQGNDGGSAHVARRRQGIAGSSGQVLLASDDLSKNE